MILFIVEQLSFNLKLANSGMSNPANEFIKTLGNISKGNVIPFINPYCDRAKEEERVYFSKRRGINNCFNVESPERIIEVTATGNDILKIRNR